MFKRPRLLAASLALSTAFLFSGCKSSAPAPAPAQSANPDGTAASAPPPANSANPSAVPAGTPATAAGAAPATPGQEAQAPPPAAPEAAPVPPPPPPPERITAAAGAAVTVRVTEQLSASKNNVGDGFTGVLESSVKSSGGGVVFPRGARVVGTVVAAKGQGKFKGSGALGIQVTSISGTPVSVSSYEKVHALSRYEATSGDDCKLGEDLRRPGRNCFRRLRLKGLPVQIRRNDCDPLGPQSHHSFH